MTKRIKRQSMRRQTKKEDEKPRRNVASRMGGVEELAKEDKITGQVRSRW
jgi:hypothetical protein